METLTRREYLARDSELQRKRGWSMAEIQRLQREQLDADDERRVDELMDRVEKLDKERRALRRAVIIEERYEPSSDWRSTPSAPRHGVPMALEQRMADLPQSRDLPESVTTERWLRALVTGRDPELRSGDLGLDGVNVPLLVSSELFDAARASMRVMQAGARTVAMESGEIVVPVLLEDPVAQWRDEFEVFASDAPNISGVALSAKSLAVATKISYEAVQDGVPMTEDVVARSLSEAIAQALDRAALLGSGSDPEPQGIMERAVPETVWTDGALDYGAILAARGAIQRRNHRPGAAVMAVRDHTSLLSSRAEDGQFIQPPPSIIEREMLHTSLLDDEIPESGSNEGQSRLIVGEWPELIIGMRQTMRIQVLHERFADEGAIGVIAHLRADVQPVRLDAFQLVTGIDPAALPESGG